MRTAALLLALACLLTSSCGGGGTPDPRDLIVGPYWAFEVSSAYSGSLPVVGTSWGVATTDGDGALAWDLTHYHHTAGWVDYDCTFTVADDHAFTVADDFRIRDYAGGIDPLGRAVIAGEVHPSHYPEMLILLARIGGFDDSTLSGPYHHVGYQYQPYPYANAVTGCTLTFDGAGNYTATDGTMVARSYVRPFTPATGLAYAVQADGGLTIDDLEVDLQLQGGVLAGGQLAVAAGGNLYDTNRTLYAMIRASQGLTDASFSGAYWMVGIENAYAGTRLLVGTLTPDGVGGFSFAGQQKASYTLSPTAPLTGTYTIAGDGALSLAIDGSSALAGALSEDRSFFVAGGGSGQVNPSYFLFGVRQ